MEIKRKSRRKFLETSAVLASGALLFSHVGSASNSASTNPEDLYLIGPKDGFSPHIGTMLSMMSMMRAWVVRQVKDLSVEELDFQLDDQSNSIGAMLMHLAATEKYYQLNTFENIPWGEWDGSVKDEWEVASVLGVNAREIIKGNNIDFYLEKLESVRKHTIEKFREQDDEWLMISEPFFPISRGVLGETNNYAKWFHVCEHESNHNGQIKFIKSRFPG
jgi:uncharacterized damage-inducible protein DinB